MEDKHEEELQECVVKAIHRIFDALPAKYKPRSDTSGKGAREWVPLSGIVVQIGRSSNVSRRVPNIPVFWLNPNYWRR